VDTSIPAAAATIAITLMTFIISLYSGSMDVQALWPNGVIISCVNFHFKRE
jgi:hypothetical protein